MMVLTPLVIVAMTDATGCCVVTRVDSPSAIGGMISVPWGIPGRSAASGCARMYFSAVSKVGGKAATTCGSSRIDVREGVRRSLASAAPFCTAGEVRYWMSCHEAPLWVEAAFIHTPNGCTRAQLLGLTDWHGSSQNATSFATFDWVGSI